MARAAMTPRAVVSCALAVVLALGWTYALLRGWSTFAGARARQRERRAEAEALVDYCETTNTKFFAFANCQEARRELDSGGTLVLALEETVGLLLAEAVDVAHRRTIDAVMALGFGGLVALAGLGMLFLVADRVLGSWAFNREVMRQYRQFSDASAFRQQIHVPVRLLENSHDD